MSCLTERVPQAVILAAGRGSRMGAASASRPKCLTPIAGKTLLEWTLAGLSANGIRNVLVVTGWQHHQLAPFPVETQLNTRWSETNMVRSLLSAEAHLSHQSTLILYGDGAYSSRSVQSALRGPNRDIVVPVDLQWESLWRRRFIDPLVDAETLAFSADRITAIGQRPERIEQIQGQFMGMLRSTPRGWQRILRWLQNFENQHGPHSVDRLDMTGLLARMLNDGEPIYWTGVHGGWVEIDSSADLAAAETGLDDPRFLHDFRT